MNAAIERAMKRSELIEAQVKSFGGGNDLALTSGAVGAIGIGAAQMANAREQERHNFGWVHAAIRVIAQRIAGQPVRVAKQTSVSAPTAGAKGLRNLSRFKNAPPFVKQLSSNLEPLDAHPLVEALANPNEYLTAYALLYVTVFQLELTGASYWWIRKEGGRNPICEIWPLPSSWVRPVHEAGRPFDHYTITPLYSGEQFDIPGEEVARLHYPEPSDPIFGQFSPLQGNARAVTTDEHIQDAQHRYFLNGIMPGLAVIVGRQPGIDGTAGERPALTRDQRAQIVTAVKQAYQGVMKKGEPIILDRLIEDVKRISQSAEEMDFMGSSELTKARITQGFGVNSISMGQVEGANRASSATADEHLVKNTVNPKIVMLSQCLTKWVAPHFGDDVVCYLEEARASDPDSDRSDREQLAKYGAITINELRAAAHLEPVEGGDELIAAGSGGLTLANSPTN